MSLNLHKCEDDVKNIVDKSVKEMNMEKSLKEFSEIWNTMQFEYISHPRTQYNLLKVREELIEILEDNQIQLQNMLSSKFVGHFYDEVADWQTKLNTADRVINIWLEVQRTWVYLEAIFIGSDDIRIQLPEDTRRFETLDKEFKVNKNMIDLPIVYTKIYKNCAIKYKNIMYCMTIHIDIIIIGNIDGYKC